jgi:tetratricopeptide (TPR) repeat protein
VLILSCSALLPGCSKARELFAGEATPSQESEVEASPNEPRTQTAEAPPSAASQGDEPAERVPAIDAATAKRFAAELAAGRQHTAKESFAEAIAAFDRALEAIPDHPRALAGRGYARLLAQELELAEEDLQRAFRRASELNLRSAVVFNLGLVAERRGDAAAARTAFLEAYALRPSAAVRAKLDAADDDEACGMRRIDAVGKTYPDWLTLWRGLAAELRTAGVTESDGMGEDPIGPEPTDIAAARKRLGVSDERGPWLVEWKSTSSESPEENLGCPVLFALVSRGAGRELHAKTVWRHDASSWKDRGCSLLWHARAELLQEPTLMVRVSDEVMGRDLVDEDCEPDADDCIRSAVSTLTMNTTAVFVGAPPRLVMNIVQVDGPDAPERTVEVGAEAVTIRGEGCDRVIPLAPASTAEPAEAHALAGPVASLDAICREALKRHEDPDVRCIPQDGPAGMEPEVKVAAPFREAALRKVIDPGRGAVTDGQCIVAVRTDEGWFHRTWECDGGMEDMLTRLEGVDAKNVTGDTGAELLVTLTESRALDDVSLAMLCGLSPAGKPTCFDPIEIAEASDPWAVIESRRARFAPALR